MACDESNKRWTAASSLLFPSRANTLEKNGRGSAQARPNEKRPRFPISIRFRAAAAGQSQHDTEDGPLCLQNSMAPSFCRHHRNGRQLVGPTAEQTGPAAVPVQPAVCLKIASMLA